MKASRLNYSETASNRRHFIQIGAVWLFSALGFGCRRGASEQTAPGNGKPSVSPVAEDDDRIAPSQSPYIDIVVRPAVVPIQQISEQTCWAVAWTILLSWKENRLFSIRDAVGQLGTPWLENFDKNEGLAAQTFTEDSFVKASKLSAEPPANYLSSAYVELLATHGPLWINTGDGILNHATVLVGAQTHRDGSIDFRFADPATGRFVTKSDAVFFNDFEREAKFIIQKGLNWDFRYQIFHW